jgi:vacuolar protein sorting-associated protein 13A/C
LYKNPASIALAKLDDVNYKFMMRENGGKLMKLIVHKINMADFRQGSKLIENKWILFKQHQS